jgi:hypothetical protein
MTLLPQASKTSSLMGPLTREILQTVPGLMRASDIGMEGSLLQKSGRDVVQLDNTLISKYSLSLVKITILKLRRVQVGLRAGPGRREMHCRRAHRAEGGYLCSKESRSGQASYVPYVPSFLCDTFA